MTESTNLRLTSKTAAWFFLLTFGWSWAFWLPAAALNGPQWSLPRTVCHLAGGLGPAVAALYLLMRDETAVEQRAFWRRVWDVRRVGFGWWLLILTGVPLLSLAAQALDAWFGGAGLALEPDFSARLERPISLLPYLLFALLFGPLPEEIGWRGTGQDALQRRNSALSSAIAVGCLWTLWHAPLFAVDGSYQHGLGVGTPRFILYQLDKVPVSILMAWVFNSTRRSTLSAIMIHFMQNLSGMVFLLTVQAETFLVLLWWLAATVVVRADVSLGRKRFSVVDDSYVSSLG